MRGKEEERNKERKKQRKKQNKTIKKTTCCLYKSSKVNTVKVGSFIQTVYEATKENKPGTAVWF